MLSLFYSFIFFIGADGGERDSESDELHEESADGLDHSAPAFLKGFHRLNADELS